MATSPIIADTHVFGSRRGYETLSRSPGVTGAEDAVLAEFGFGQSSDERFLGELASRPTALGRSLPSGRFAITRVLKGPPDDGGRPTLERRTAILAPGDYLSLRHSLSRLIASRSLWESHAFAEGRALSLPPGPESSGFAVPRDWQLFDAWVIALEQQRAVVVGSDDAAAEDILRLAGKISPRDALRYRWGIRMLAPISWVDVLSLSPSGALDNRRQVHGVSSGGCVHPLVRGAMGASPDAIPAIDDLRAVAGRVASRSAGDGSLFAEAMRDTGTLARPRAASGADSRRALPRTVILAGGAALLGVVAGIVALVVLRPSTVPPAGTVDAGPPAVNESTPPPPAAPAAPTAPAAPAPAPAPADSIPSQPAPTEPAPAELAPVEPAPAQPPDDAAQEEKPSEGRGSEPPSPSGSDEGGSRSRGVDASPAPPVTDAPSQEEIDRARQRIEAAIRALKSAREFSTRIIEFRAKMSDVRTGVLDKKDDRDSSTPKGKTLEQLSDDLLKQKFRRSSEFFDELAGRVKNCERELGLSEALNKEPEIRTEIEKSFDRSALELQGAMSNCSSLSQPAARACGDRVAKCLEATKSQPLTAADAIELCVALAIATEMSSPSSGFGSYEFALWAKRESLENWKTQPKPWNNDWAELQPRLDRIRSVIARWQRQSERVVSGGFDESLDGWIAVVSHLDAQGLYAVSMPSAPWWGEWLCASRWSTLHFNDSEVLTPGRLLEKLLSHSSIGPQGGHDAGSDQLKSLKDEALGLLGRPRDP